MSHFLQKDVVVCICVRHFCLFNLLTDLVKVYLLSSVFQELLIQSKYIYLCTLGSILDIRDGVFFLLSRIFALINLQSSLLKWWWIKQTYQPDACVTLAKYQKKHLVEGNLYLAHSLRRLNPLSVPSTVAMVACSGLFLILWQTTSREGGQEEDSTRYIQDFLSGLPPTMSHLPVYQHVMSLVKQKKVVCSKLQCPQNNF